MQTIKFRPLRSINKTEKITVASYMQWRKVKTADYEEFILIIDDEYRRMSPEELVHDHKGNVLFWYNYTNPDALPLNYANIENIIDLLKVESSVFEGEEWKLRAPLTKGFDPSVKGFDCDGVPVFSHNTTEYVAKHYNDMTQFEPLTVGMVIKWFGWFLYQLENNTLKFKEND